MQVKDRVIRFEKIKTSTRQENLFIVDEYGIEGEEIYHRRIAISEDIYDTFEKEIDDEMHLDVFLQRYDINSEWKRYELKLPKSENVKNELIDSSRLFADLELEEILRSGTELDEQTKNRVYKLVYNKLFENETLIENPLVLDVFNEALREDPESAIWESVFPFFR